MESSIVKGIVEALMSKNSGDPEDGGIVQIKISSQTNKSKRVRDSFDKNVEVAKKIKRKPEKNRHEKKPREKRY